MVTPLDPKWIKMFSEAQEYLNWKPEVGDRYVVSEPPIRLQYILLVDTFCVESLQRKIKKDRVSETFLPSVEWMAGVWRKEFPNGEPIVFLDQLHAWTDDNILNVTWPLPIIVLAFLMSDCYSKTWSETEKEWV